MTSSVNDLAIIFFVIVPDSLMERGLDSRVIIIDKTAFQVSEGESRFTYA